MIRLLAGVAALRSEFKTMRRYRACRCGFCRFFLGVTIKGSNILLY